MSEGRMAVYVAARFASFLPDRSPQLTLLPSSPQGNTLNTPSSKAANRLGFTKEGLARMNRVLPPGQVGTHAGPPGDEARRSRDTEVWAMCWDEWEEGKKQRLWEMVTRKYGDSKGKIE